LELFLLDFGPSLEQTFASDINYHTRGPPCKEDWRKVELVEMLATITNPKARQTLKRKYLRPMATGKPCDERGGLGG
jgi:hypothetical protein